MARCLVITGGSHGIGEKTIALFIAQGWKAVNLSRTNCTLPGVFNINVDLAKDNWQEECKDKLFSTVDHVDQICLVHNAAIFNSDTVCNLTEKEMRSVLNVNVISPVVLNHLLIPKMKAGSSIIYIGSTLAEMAVPGRASYVISKHAVIGMMRATCQDLREHGVHTCCICPGFVNTKMLVDGVDKKLLMDFINTKVIAKRLIEPEEIAEFINYCANHPIVNGAVLHTNLGQVES